MLLALDIGNTNIKVGLFEGTKLQHSWRLSLDRRGTADEYGVKMEAFFRHIELPRTVVTGGILSSVVPSMNYTIEHMFSIYFPGVQVVQVSAHINLGIGMRYDVPDRLGSDRICNAVAAAKLYGGPCITVDFGTATTFGVISENNEFLGGPICPGFKIATEALTENTALLPKIELIKPDTVIGTNTDHCIRAGIIYGFVGQIEYLVNKIRQELGHKAPVIATGGMSELIHSESNCIDLLNPILTLEGLSLIYEMNA